MLTLKKDKTSTEIVELHMRRASTTHTTARRKAMSLLLLARRHSLDLQAPGYVLHRDIVVIVDTIVVVRCVVQPARFDIPITRGFEAVGNCGASRVGVGPRIALRGRVSVAGLRPLVGGLTVSGFGIAFGVDERW